MVEVITTGPMVAILLALGLCAGIIGGLLGVGGSVVMLPVLVMLLGQDKHPGLHQHTYQAATMIANVMVAFPAAVKHWRKQAINWAVVRTMAPAAVLAGLLGVALSNQFRGTQGSIWLARLLGLFLLYQVIYNLRQWWTKSDHQPLPPHPRVTQPRCIGIGGLAGTLSGLLGIGGGLVMVPLQQTLLRIPLRQCIANSATVMVPAVAVGALAKNLTLQEHVDTPWFGGLVMATLLTPTCIVGGYLGAHLTHRLPVRQVRMAFVLLMAVFVVRLAHLPWPW